MAQNLQSYISGGVIFVLLVLSTATIVWEFNKDYSKLSRDGEVLARTRWSVEAQRTYFVLDSWYDKNVKCPKILDLGGHTTATRCYYPDDYYEQLSRSLIRTKITTEEIGDELTVTKLTPYYKYGTRGAYAGKILENFNFVETDVEEEFPKSYYVDWNPTDTRNYRLIWRVWDLKELDLPDGDYHYCSYKFGKVSIDLKDECSKLEKAEVKGDRIWFYFYPVRKVQYFDISLVDPEEQEPVYSYNQIKLYEVNSNHTVKWNTEKDTYVLNKECEWYLINLSWRECYEYNDTVTVQHSEVIIDSTWQILDVDGEIINVTHDWHYWFYDNKTGYVGKDMWDGDGNQKIEKIKPGTEYVYFPYNYSVEKTVNEGRKGFEKLDQIETKIVIAEEKKQ